MRRKIVSGNWKMNLNIAESTALINDLKNYLSKNKVNCSVYVGPASVLLPSTVETAKGSDVQVMAQNMHQADNGAFTGEISANMLQDIGVTKVILGHSERRQYFGETNEILAEKVKKAIEKGLEVIFCNGETLAERKSETHFAIIKEQTEKALFHLSAEQLKQVIVAYEPVWAIGTGETASPEQAQEIHAFIRSLFVEKYGNEVAQSISILYGGSVKPNNAKEIFSQLDVDGGLVGGASLKSSDFIGIIEAYA